MAKEYAKEVRLAVVMYGGISLAIYMYGIASELLELVRSTAPKKLDEDDVPNDYCLEGTAKIYRQVASLAATGEVNGPRCNRFTIDILSGTSAGGLNGMFLGKALANNQSISSLKNLWIKDGDINQLLDDRNGKPASLLKSDFMYDKLKEALDGMDNPSVSINPCRQPLDLRLADSVDLFMTSTDLHGLILPLELGNDERIFEKRYRTVFHFEYQRLGLKQNDFKEKNNAFLAFVGRCTSSFPVAFEPMTLIDAQLNSKDNGLVDKCKYFFADYWRGSAVLMEQLRTNNATSVRPTDEDASEIARKGFLKRPFGDGGFLDNKPFDFATRALQTKSAPVPVERKLLYVEPAPDHPELEQPDLSKPNALETAFLAMTLPGNQTIRDSINLIRERNSTTSRISRIVDQIDEIVNVPKLSNDFAYLALKVGDTTDFLTDIVCRIINLENSSPYRSAVEDLVRAWRTDEYREIDEVNEPECPDPESKSKSKKTDQDYKETRSKKAMTDFLGDFDLNYHLRRIAFVQLQLDRRLERALPASERLQKEYDDLNGIEKKLGCQTDQTKVTSFKDRHVKERSMPQGTVDPKEIFRLKKALDKDYQLLLSFAEVYKGDPPAKTPGQVDEDELPKRTIQSLQIELRELGTILAFADHEHRVAKARQVLHKEVNGKSRLDLLSQGAKQFSNLLKSKATDVEKRIKKLLGLPKDLDGRANPDCFGDKKAAAWYYSFFDYYDSTVFPIVYGVGAIESKEIDIVRVSPDDAKTLKPYSPANEVKLAGTSLGHFGAFLYDQGRSNDILWGRLDASEQLIRLLLPIPLAIEEVGTEKPTEQNEKTLGLRRMRDLLICRAQLSIILDSRGGCDAPTLGKLILRSVGAFCGLDPDGPEYRELAQNSTKLADQAAIISETDATEFKNTIEDWHKFDNEAMHKYNLQQALSPLNTKKVTALPPAKGLMISAYALLPDQALGLAGRALKTIGRMFDTISDSLKKPAGIISRIGALVAFFAQLAFPKESIDFSLRNVLRLILILESVLLITGVLFDKAIVNATGSAVLGTIFVYIAIEFIRSSFKKNSLTWLIVVIASAFVCAATVDGMYGWVEAWKGQADSGPVYKIVKGVGSFFHKDVPLLNNDGSTAAPASSQPKRRLMHPPSRQRPPAEARP